MFILYFSTLLNDLIESEDFQLIFLENPLWIPFSIFLEDSKELTGGLMVRDSVKRVFISRKNYFKFSIIITVVISKITFKA